MLISKAFEVIFIVARQESNLNQRLCAFNSKSLFCFLSFMIETTAYPRAALIGNPSDGYFGKTIAFTFKNFEARVQLREQCH
jgi:hypothetical protein